MQSDYPKWRYFMGKAWNLEQNKAVNLLGSTNVSWVVTRSLDSAPTNAWISFTGANMEWDKKGTTYHLQIHHLLLRGSLGTQRKTVTWVWVLVVWVQALTTVVISARGLQTTEKEINQLPNLSFLFSEEDHDVWLNGLSGQGLTVAQEHRITLETLSLKTKGQGYSPVEWILYCTWDCCKALLSENLQKRRSQQLHSLLDTKSCLWSLDSCNHCCLQLLCLWRLLKMIILL